MWVYSFRDKCFIDSFKITRVSRVLNTGFTFTSEIFQAFSCRPLATNIEQELWL